MKNYSAIKQMYFGERGDYQQIKKSIKEDELLSQMVKYDDIIRQKLSSSPELSELYEKSHDALEDLWNEITDNHYIEGFKFGFLMGMEIGMDAKIHAENDDC